MKLSLTLIALAVMVISSSANAQTGHPSAHHRMEMHHDHMKIHQDHKNIQHDKKDIAHDVKEDRKSVV